MRTNLSADKIIKIEDVDVVTDKAPPPQDSAMRLRLHMINQENHVQCSG
jgi:hypothetical protein